MFPCGGNISKNHKRYVKIYQKLYNARQKFINTIGRALVLSINF